MRSLEILSVLASCVEERRQIMFNDYGRHNNEYSYAVEIEGAIDILDVMRQLLVEYRLTQRKADNVAECLELSNAVGLESLPTEILRDIVDHLPLQDVEQLSCASKRLREVCLPSLFRRVKFEFSQAGFEQLKSIVESDVRHHVVSFTYIVPDLLRNGKYLLCYDEPGLTLYRNTRFRSFQVRDLDP
jgi:hypothetical protein